MAAAAIASGAVAFVDVAVAAGVPVTELLNPAKARRRPIEQRAKPIKGQERRRMTARVEVPNDLLARLIISLRESEFDRFRANFINQHLSLRTKAVVHG
jgi:hypothetical protein